MSWEQELYPSLGRHYFIAEKYEEENNNMTRTRHPSIRRSNMSRGQGHKHATSAYFGQKRFGWDNHEEGGGHAHQRNYFNGNNRGGRGGGRKQQQPRICYINADFLNQGSPEFQSQMNLNGIKNRVGWNSSMGNCAMGNTQTRLQVDNRSRTITPEERLNKDSEEINRRNMTLPISQRLEIRRNNFKHGGDANDDNRSRTITPEERLNKASEEINRRNMTVTVPMSQRLGNVRNFQHGGGASDELRTRSREEDFIHRKRRHHREHGHKHHTKSRRYRKLKEEEDSGDSSLSDEEEYEDEGDLRYTLSRKRSNFRREPGEIVDSDESARSSLQAKTEKIDVVQEQAANSRKPSSATKKKSGLAQDSKPRTPVQPVVEFRPITADSLSQSTQKTNTSGISLETIKSAESTRLEKIDDCAEKQDRPTVSKENEGTDQSLDEGELLSGEQGRLIIAEDENHSTPKESPANVLNAPRAFSAPGLQTESAHVDLDSTLPTILKQNTNSSAVTELLGNEKDDLLARMEHLKKELKTIVEKNKEKDKLITSLKLERQLVEEKENKIKILRGKKTQMENEIEERKKNSSKIEKQLKEADHKLKKAESELKSKNEELESLKRSSHFEASSDSNKPDVQLVFAMAYQDKLYVEVEKVKSAFEIEVLKLQEYYDARLSHYRHQGLHPGAFMGLPVGNNFPKGCVVTPMTIGQAMQQQAQGHQDQQPGNIRPGQQQQMGMFAHLGNPDSVGPPHIPPGLSRTRLPMFINPLARRVQQGMAMEAQNQNNAQQNLNATSNPSNAGNINNPSNSVSGSNFGRT